MIVHVVLFRPKVSVTDADADRLIAGLRHTLANAPSIRRFQAGRRVLVGRGYEQLMRADYPYAATFEFDDVAGLKAYLEHPSHDGVGAALFAAAEDVLIYDYDMGAGTAGLSAVATPT
jgi:hypothetical protein